MRINNQTIIKLSIFAYKGKTILRDLKINVKVSALLLCID